MSKASNSVAGDFSYLCRLCLGSDEEEMRVIFPLAVKVELVTRLSVADGDGLPTYICSHCKLELDSASDFINRCINNDSLLRSNHDETHPEHSIVIKEEIMERGIEEYYDIDNNDAGNEDQNSYVLDRDDLVVQTIPPSNSEPESNNFGEMFAVVNIPEPPDYVFESENSDDDKIADTNVEENVLADVPSIEQKPRINLIKMYACKLCDESFNMKSYRNAHMRSHGAYVPEQSDIEGRLYGTKSLARNHSENVAAKSTSANCVPNKKKGVSIVKVVTDQSSVKTTKQLKPRVISKSPVKTGTEKTVVLFNNNKLAEKKPAKRTFPCASCDKVFSNNKAMLEHRICHRTKLKNQDIARVATAKEKTIPWVKNRVNSKGKVKSSQSRATTTMKLEPQPLKNSSLKTGSPSTRASVKRSVRPSNGRKLTEVKSMSETFPCTDCDRVFSSNKAMLVHRMYHRKKMTKATFPCTTCDTVFTNNKSLLIHRRCHKTARSKTATFPCATCGKTFPTNDKLLIHALCHTSKSTESSFPCDVCRNIFTTKKEMLIHLNRHAIKRVHKCTNCNKRFADKTSLKYHARVHAKLVKFSCGQCGEEFGNRSHLYHHKRFHAAEKPYKCAECDEDFVDEVSLLCHFKVHANKPAFECDKCGGEFEREDELVEHAKSHIVRPKKSLGTDGGGADWTCDTCGRKFAKKAYLGQHLKIHKINKCSKCGEEFDTKSLLATHMQFHEEDNPYKCAVCEAEFGNEVALFDHFKCHVAK